MSKLFSKFGAIGLGLSLVFLMGAAYTVFQPGGALSGTWNSQNVALDSGATFITGTLPFNRGGTNLASAADDTTLISSGSAWAASAIPDCTDTVGQHLNYTASTNALSCGTTDSATAPTSGTFTITWENACTTSPTTVVKYYQFNRVVTWNIAAMSAASCTSDSTSFATTTAIVPAAIRPTTQQTSVSPFNLNNAVTALGCITVKTDGTVAAHPPGTACTTNAAGWLGSGNVAVNPGIVTDFTYTLD